MLQMLAEVYATFEEETNFTDAGYFVKIDTKDEPGLGDYYHWQMYVNDTLLVLPDPGNQANLIVSDEFFDGQEIKAYKPNEEIILEIGDVVEVRQLGISEEYFNFLYQIFGQTLSIPIVGNPPPVRIQGNLKHSNFENGDYVLGYFSVVSFSTAKTEVQE